MIEIDKVIQRRQEIAELRHADGVFRDIQARVKERENYEQRWFWELLQNAKDAVEDGEVVQARIEVSADKLIFSHTGNPFELDDILSLIIQGSSKTGKEGKDGRFGTGFMTTYLLSKKVTITGSLLNDEGYFRFLLNREGENNPDFFDNQIESNKAFDSSLQPISYLQQTAYQTQFEYELDTGGVDTANAGLQSMDELIPFTQLFNNKISVVEMVRDNEIVIYRKTFVEDITLNGKVINHFRLETLINEVQAKCFFAYLLHTGESEVCLLTDIQDSGEMVVHLDDKFPRLYFTFPLIGTEEFGIPLVVNSSKFDPRIERDGIYLLSGQLKDHVQKVETEYISNNKRILKEALTEASVVFAELMFQRKIGGVYELFNYQPARDYTWLDIIWLNDIKKQLFIKLSALNCLTGFREQPVSLNQLKIPYAINRDTAEVIWELAACFKKYDVPVFAELHAWINVCIAQTKVQQVEIDSLVMIYQLKNLISEIEHVENLRALEIELTEATEKWLNKFYGMVASENEIFPLENTIMLSQKKVFRATDGMSWDECNDDELKAISKITGLDFKGFLIDNSINPINIAGVKAFTEAKAVNSLSNFFTITIDADYSKPELQEATGRYLKWLIEKRSIEIIKDLKIISGDRKKEEDVLTIQSFPKGKHLLLPPKAFFSSDFPLYAGIIRDRDCMHPIYYQNLTVEGFQFLSANGFIHISPLVIKTEKLDNKALELLLINPEDLNLLKDEDGKLTQQVEVTFSDFAYLTTTEGHIYERNATTTSSIERFKFLLLEASEKDTLFDKDQAEITLEDGNRTIGLHQCLWIYRAKENQWINLKKTADSEKKFSEAPSSKNLSTLIKDDTELIKKIKGERQQRFLTRLGVGVSDLIRNTLPNDELRESWDKAITSMIISDADPELVQEIFNDAGIKIEYERRLNERKLINRNQHIGGLVEKLFRQAIEELNKTGTNVHIDREPIGSDYILMNESSDLVNKDRKREAFKIGSWLVELKATGRDYAAMTLTQAQTAMQRKDAYALVVVPLYSSEPDLEYVKKEARVVTNIGYHIDEIIGEYDEVELMKQHLTSGKDGVSVVIEEKDVRFRVGAELWPRDTSPTIEDFIKSRFSSKVL